MRAGTMARALSGAASLVTSRRICDGDAFDRVKPDKRRIDLDLSEVGTSAGVRGEAIAIEVDSGFFAKRDALIALANCCANLQKRDVTAINMYY